MIPIPMGDLGGMAGDAMEVLGQIKEFVTDLFQGMPSETEKTLFAARDSMSKAGFAELYPTDPPRYQTLNNWAKGVLPASIMGEWGEVERFWAKPGSHNVAMLWVSDTQHHAIMTEASMGLWGIQPPAVSDISAQILLLDDSSYPPKPIGWAGGSKFGQATIGQTASTAAGGQIVQPVPGSTQPPSTPSTPSTTGTPLGPSYPGSMIAGPGFFRTAEIGARRLVGGK